MVQWVELWRLCKVRSAPVTNDRCMRMRVSKVKQAAGKMSLHAKRKCNPHNLRCIYYHTAKITGSQCAS